MNKLFVSAVALGVFIATVSVIFFATKNGVGSDQSDNDVAHQHQGGRVAYIDPETGELTSQPAETDRLDELQSTRIESSSQQVFDVAPVERVMDDGSVMVKLNGQYNKPLTMVLDEKGEPEINHEGEGHTEDKNH